MFSKKRIAVLVTVLVIVAVMLPACAPKQEEPTEKVITIGAALSLTGTMAREGALTKEGYDIVIEKVNDHGGVDVGGQMYTLEIKYYDDESDAQRSTKLVEKLITEDGIMFILGPYSSGITVASSVISEKHQAIMIATQATADNLYQRDFKYFFGTMGTSSAGPIPGLQAVLAQDPKPQNEAIIAADSLFPLASAAGNRAYANSIGLEIVYDEKFPQDATDLSPILSQVRALDPDILEVHGFFGHSVLVVKQLKELGWAPRALIMDVGPTMPDFPEALGADADYCMSSQYWGLTSMYNDPIFGDTAKYIEEFNAKYKKDPDYHNVSASVGAMCFVLGIEQAGSLDVDKVRDEIEAFDFDTIYGPLRFSEGHANIGVPGVVLQVQNGAAVSVFPAEAAGGEIWYPMPAWNER
jgi:branched-chain amino acid transport system substrate-binding protein